MRPSTASTAFSFVLLLSLTQYPVEAHTWIDCIDTDRSKVYDQSASYTFGGAGGNGFCDGYGAGYPGRGDTNIGTEFTYKMLQNEVEAGTAVCETVDADTYTNTDWRTRLSVAAGETVYFAYLPNGHIVKDKKAIGTQHGIYWTGEVGTSLTSTLEMTADNLLDGYTLDFDDGNCGESVDSEGNPGGRAGDGKPCIGSFVIPTGTAEGIYSFVWYWTFWLDDASDYVDQSQASGYFGAAYSTCFEVEVTSSGSVAATTAPAATTAAPATTTAAPATTTAAPAATTVVPAVVTPAPAETTTAPAATTAALVATAAPMATTESPLETTTAPEVATSPPAAIEDGGGYRSMDELDVVATVHPADTSSASESEAGSAAQVGSGSIAIEIEVQVPFAGQNPMSTSSASDLEESEVIEDAGNAAATTESSFAASMTNGQHWLVLICALAVGAQQ